MSNFFNLLISNLKASIEIESPILDKDSLKKPPPV